MCVEKLGRVVNVNAQLKNAPSFAKKCPAVKKEIAKKMSETEMGKLGPFLRFYVSLHFRRLGHWRYFCIGATAIAIPPLRNCGCAITKTSGIAVAPSDDQMALRR